VAHATMTRKTEKNNEKVPCVITNEHYPATDRSRILSKFWEKEVRGQRFLGKRSLPRVIIFGGRKVISSWFPLKEEEGISRL
jgi:hypothetical protein